MISLENTALQQALQLAQSPELRLMMQKSPLPYDVTDLIRLISEDAGKRADVARALELSPETLQQCLIDYYHNICLYPGSSPERILALNPAAELRLAKEHHRLLIKWLHPDRNPDNAVLAEQVNRAWSQLKATRNVPPPVISSNATPADLPKWQPQAAPAVKSRFPLFLALLAVAGLALLLLATLPDREIYSGIDEQAGKQASDKAISAPNSKEMPELNQLASASWAEQSPAKTEALAAPSEQISPQQAIPSSIPPEKTAKSSSAEPSLLSPLTQPTQALPAPAAKDAMAGQEPPKAITQQQAAEPIMPAVIVQSFETKVFAEPVSQAEAAALVKSFQQHYRQGDTSEFMRLFSSGAQNNRGDRAAIEADYRRLFEASYFREVSLSNMQWQGSQEGLRLNARFVSRVQRESDRTPVKNKGGLSLQFIREAGQARIHRILITP